MYQHFGLNLSFRTIATNLNVDASTVCRIINRFETTGSVSKKAHPQGNSHHRKVLKSADEFLILELVAERPGIYLSELQAEIHHTTGSTSVSTATICNFLHKNRFTHKRMTRIAWQRCEAQRAQFMSDLSVFPIEMLVFVDESGTDRRDTLRRYGYSLRGQLKPFSVGAHMSLWWLLCALMV